MRSGAARSNAAASADSGPSEVSTATRQSKSLQPGHHVGVPGVRHAGRQRSGQHHPVRGRGARDHRVGQRGQGRSVEQRAGFVEFGRGAVGFGDRQVGPHGAADRDGGRGDTGGVEQGEERVAGGGRQYGHRVDAGQREGTGDVDTLAARLAGHRLQAVHGAAGQRGVERDGPVDARVRGDGDDHD